MNWALLHLVPPVEQDEGRSQDEGGGPSCLQMCLSDDSASGLVDRTLTEMEMILWM